MSKILYYIETLKKTHLSARQFYRTNSINTISFHLTNSTLLKLNKNNKKKQNFNRINQEFAYQHLIKNKLEVFFESLKKSQRKRIMDAVHEAQQPMDIGVCQEHNRVYECYCTQCYCMICPSCLMFDSHKGHIVCRIEEGSKDLRSRINGAARDGLLKFEKTQNVLLDVRHARLSLQENFQKILKTTQESFDLILKTLKARKQAFIQQIEEFYRSQIDKIEQIENIWLQKQQICQKVLKLQGSSDDMKIMQQAGFVVEGLQKLAQPMNYHEFNLIEDIERNIIINKQKYEYSVLKDSFKDFIKKGTIISNKLRC